MTGWDEFPDAPSEVTQFTDAARAYAKGSALEVFEKPRFASDGSELRILNDADDPQYLVSVMGQRPAHGLQGSYPERIQYLRELGIPVFMVFIQGSGDPSATTVWSEWLHVLPAAQPISLEVGNKRYGWRCRDLNPRRELVFPQSIPLKPPTELF